MPKILHQVWIQGKDNLPKAYVSNRDMWRSVLPADWEMILWDNATAAARWPGYAAIQRLCSSHAMRADLILARALRDIGGLITDTDCRPVNPKGMLSFIDNNPTMIVLQARYELVSCGLAWSANPRHGFFVALCAHQLRKRKLLSSRDVVTITGPRAWWAALRARHWDLCLVTSRRAYVRQYNEHKVVNPNAWVNPGYAASWLKRVAK